MCQARGRRQQIHPPNAPNKHERSYNRWHIGSLNRWASVYDMARNEHDREVEPSRSLQKYGRGDGTQFEPDRISEAVTPILIAAFVACPAGGISSP